MFLVKFLCLSVGPWPDWNGSKKSPLNVGLDPNHRVDTQIIFFHFCSLFEIGHLASVAAQQQCNV